MRKLIRENVAFGGTSRPRSALIITHFATPTRPARPSHRIQRRAHEHILALVVGANVLSRHASTSPRTSLRSTATPMPVSINDAELWQAYIERSDSSDEYGHSGMVPRLASDRGRDSDLLADKDVMRIADDFPVSVINPLPFYWASIKPLGQVAERITCLHFVVHRFNR